MLLDQVHRVHVYIVSLVHISLGGFERLACTTAHYLAEVSVVVGITAAVTLTEGKVGLVAPDSVFEA